MSGSRAGSTRFAIRNNSRVAYGPGTTPEGVGDQRAVVLLHDLLFDRNEFAAQRSALGVGSRVIAVDARGHGASATLANQWYTMSELAQDVIAILNLEEITSAHLIGHGLGGAVAFEIARRHPAWTTSLTLIEPSLYSVLDNDASAAEASGLRNELRTTDRAAADAAYKGLTDKALDVYLSPRWGQAWRESTSKPRLAAIRRHAGALSGMLPAIDAYVVPKNELRLFLVPTLLIVGEGSHTVIRLTAERIVAQIPAGRLVTIPFGNRAAGPFSGDGASALNRELAASLYDLESE